MLIRQDLVFQRRTALFVNLELDTAVVVTTFGGLVGVDRLAFAEALPSDALLGDTVLDEVVEDGLRAALGLYTNLRPARLYKALSGKCPLRADIVEKGFDLLMVRELTGGIYFGERGRREGKYGAEGQFGGVLGIAAGEADGEGRG